MLDLYLTDEVDILTVAHDADGVETTIASLGVRARVQEKHRLVLDQRGEEVLGSMQLMLALGSGLTYESKIRVKKICGVAYGLPSKTWQVKSISTGHGFGAEFTEAWI